MMIMSENLLSQRWVLAESVPNKNNTCICSDTEDGITLAYYYLCK